jgi:hypothetical protein
MNWQHGRRGRNRTCNPRIRNPMLYPFELRARLFFPHSNRGHLQLLIYRVSPSQNRLWIAMQSESVAKYSHFAARVSSVSITI